MKIIFLPLALLSAASVSGLLAQPKINLDGFDDSEMPPDLVVKERSVDGGMERTGVDSSGRVHYEMTVDQSGNLLKDTVVRKYVYDTEGNYIIMDLDAQGELVPMKLGAYYCWIAPGPKGQFTRKAWLNLDSVILEEERREYDEQGRLTREGFVDPVSGSFTEEYRHRYSEDGKIQFTTEFRNGQQAGAESQATLPGD